MKNLQLIFIIGFFLTLYSCDQNNGDGKIVFHKNDSIPPKPTEKILTREEERELIDEEIRLDSLRTDSVLQNALRTAMEYTKSDSFFTEDMFLGPDYFLGLFDVSITAGHLFSKKDKHILIKRIIHGNVYLDLYLIENNKLRSVVCRVDHLMSCIGDTIQDVNGDNLKDFLVTSYAPSGCCLRNNYDVYLYQPGKTAFKNHYEFMNPTFFPKEKIIRGIYYGFTGEVGLYKYKWNGLKIVVIEEIYPDEKNKKQFIKISYLPTEKEVILKEVPKEYLNIKDYDWFSDY